MQGKGQRSCLEVVYFPAFSQDSCPLFGSPPLLTLTPPLSPQPIQHRHTWMPCCCNSWAWLRQPSILCEPNSKMGTLQTHFCSQGEEHSAPQNMSGCWQLLCVALCREEPLTRLRQQDCTICYVQGCGFGTRGGFFFFFEFCWQDR